MRIAKEEQNKNFCAYDAHLDQWNVVMDDSALPGLLYRVDMGNIYYMPEVPKTLPNSANMQKGQEAEFVGWLAQDCWKGGYCFSGALPHVTFLPQHDVRIVHHVWQCGAPSSCVLCMPADSAGMRLHAGGFTPAEASGRNPPGIMLDIVRETAMVVPTGATSAAPLFQLVPVAGNLLHYSRRRPPFHLEVTTTSCPPSIESLST